MTVFVKGIILGICIVLGIELILVMFSALYHLIVYGEDAGPYE